MTTLREKNIATLLDLGFSKVAKPPLWSLIPHSDATYSNGPIYAGVREHFVMGEYGLPTTAPIFKNAIRVLCLDNGLPIPYVWERKLILEPGETVSGGQTGICVIGIDGTDAREVYTQISASRELLLHTTSMPNIPNIATQLFLQQNMYELFGDYHGLTAALYFCMGSSLFSETSESTIVSEEWRAVRNMQHIDKIEEAFDVLDTEFERTPRRRDMIMCLMDYICLVSTYTDYDPIPYLNKVFREAKILAPQIASQPEIRGN